jgi:hypothetical protein
MRALLLLLLLTACSPGAASPWQRTDGKPIAPGQFDLDYRACRDQTYARDSVLDAKPTRDQRQAVRDYFDDCMREHGYRRVQ